MAESLLLSHVTVEASIKGIRGGGTRSPILLYDDATGDTILRALDVGGGIAFQNAAGDPLTATFDVAWTSVTGTPTTLAGYGITDAAALSHTHAWAEVSKAGSSLADLATRSAADLSSGTLADGRVAQSNVTQHQAALALAASQITSGALAVARGGTGLSAISAGALLYASGVNTLSALAAGTNGHVLTLTAGVPSWAAPTGGLSNAFTSIANSVGGPQFSASGADAIQFAAGADLSVAFDAVNKRVTFAYTGSTSGILRGYADINTDSGSIAAVGADAVSFFGAGGIVTSATSGTPDTVTITLSNVNASLLTGNIVNGRLSGGYTGVTGVGTLTAGTWNATIVGAQYGGTGVNGSAAANGALLIGNGSGYSLATLTAGTGITITNSAGGISIAASVGLVGAKAYRNTTVAVPFATDTAISLTTAVWDTDGYLSGGNLVVPTGKGGRYRLTLSSYSTNNYWAANFSPHSYVAKLGSTKILEVAWAGLQNGNSGSVELDLAAGDVISILARQDADSGGNWTAAGTATAMSVSLTKI